MIFEGRRIDSAPERAIPVALLAVLLLLPSPARAGEQANPGREGTALPDPRSASWPPLPSGDLPSRGVTVPPVRWATGDGGNDTPYWRTNLLKRFAVDQKYAFTTWWPSEVRRAGFSVPLGISLGIAVSSRHGGDGLDNRADLLVGRWMRGKAKGPARALSRAGDMETAAVALGVTWVASRLTGNDRLAETTSLSAEALLNAGVWNVALKKVSSRTRPGQGTTGNLLDGRGSSFPSGHAMGSFAVAAVVSARYPEKRWVPWVAYGSASVITASRVALGKHYVTDVAAGATLGRSLGRMVVARSREEAPPRTARTWTPIVDPAGPTLGVAYNVSW